MRPAPSRGVGGGGSYYHGGNTLVLGGGGYYPPPLYWSMWHPWGGTYYGDGGAAFVHEGWGLHGWAWLCILIAFVAFVIVLVKIIQED